MFVVENDKIVEISATLIMKLQRFYIFNVTRTQCNWISCAALKSILFKLNFLGNTKFGL